MKIGYNPEIDALYIRLIEGKHECRTVRLVLEAWDRMIEPLKR